MSIDKLKRIMWRLRETTTTHTIRCSNGNHKYTLPEVRLAIIQEIGGDIRTIKKYIALLKEVKQLKRIHRHYFEDTAGVI